jgi:hypothetical protein
MNKDDKQVVLTYPIGEPLLARRTIAWQIEDLAKNRLTHFIVRRVIAGRMPDWNRSLVEPAHFLIKPMTPLRSELVGVRSQS